jgi:hypothetical protein
VRFHSLRLPFDFDASALQHDVQSIPDESWVSHYNQSDYEGNWSGIALRSRSGSPQDLIVGQGPYTETPVLEQCNALRDVLARFECPLTAVRLLRLHPGSLIKEHCDPALGFEDGEVRIHIPVQSSDQVFFYLDGRRVILREGETWYLDLSRRHRIENRGPADRIHLVIDGVVDDWVRRIFHQASQVPGAMELPPEAITAFDRFREFIFDSPELQQALFAETDRSAFIELAVRLGRIHGYAFEADLVESAIRRGREAWNTRWENA